MKKPKWRLIFVRDGSYEIWYVCRPNPQDTIAHFACDTLDDAVDVAIRSMALLDRVTIRDRI